MRYLLICLGIIFLLLLTSINIKNYLAPKKVLGIRIQSEDPTKFWKDFVDKNPNYVPGWIEIGRIDRIKDIDPNYLIP